MITFNRYYQKVMSLKMAATDVQTLEKQEVVFGRHRYKELPNVTLGILDK